MRALKRLGSKVGKAALQLGLAGILLGSPVWAQAHDASAGLTRKQIYPPIEQANPDIRQALAEARRTHKRVLLDFGGDWCPDCQVLNYYFAQSPNAELLAKNYVRVNVNAGRIDANLDVAKRYGVDLKAVPALSVLAPDGTVVYAQTKEFSNMRHMESSGRDAVPEPVETLKFFAVFSDPLSWIKAVEAASLEPPAKQLWRDTDSG